MLNSAEHEILNAHNYKNIKKLRTFHAQISLEMLFFLLIKVEMPCQQLNIVLSPRGQVLF